MFDRDVIYSEEELVENQYIFIFIYKNSTFGSEAVVVLCSFS